MKTVAYILPWPPTLNTYWRWTPQGPKLSKPGRAYKVAVQAAVLEQGIERFEGVVTATWDFFPARRGCDMDNRFKAVLDSLEKAGVYENDNQVRIYDRAELHDPDGDPRVELTLRGEPTS